MRKKTRKVLIVSTKIVIAAVMLAWVVGQVHWHDYVLGRDGRQYAVVQAFPSSEAPQKLHVRQGMLWWKSERSLPAEQFQPIAAGGNVIRMGFASSMKHIRIAPMILAALGFPLSLLIVAYRWRLLLAVLEVRIRLWEAVRLTFLGQFFNAVVPGVVGGDLAKAYYVFQHTPHKAAVLVSVLVDRVLGLTEMTLLSAAMLGAALLWTDTTYRDLRGPLLTLGVVMLLLMVAVLFLFSGGFRRLLHLQRFYQRFSFAHHISAMGEAAVAYEKRIGAMLEAILITLGAHITWVGAIALIGYSLALPIPWYLYFVYIPLIYTLGAVPLTPGGIGVIEKLYLVFFAVSSAVSPSGVLAMALLARLIPMFWGIPGAVVAVTGPKIPKPESIEAELALEGEAPASNRR